MTIITITLVLFAVAALGGLTLAILRLRSKTLPLPLALGHGALAAAGLVDYLALPKKDPAERTGLQHMMVMLTAVCFYGGSMPYQTAAEIVPRAAGNQLIMNRQL